MSKRKAHIILSKLLLFFFAAGQIVVYAHQHHTKYRALIVDSRHSHSTDKHQTVQEKCNFCDQMHQATISCVHHSDYGIILTPSVFIYAVIQHHYKGNSLIHADGLSPPALS